MKKVIFTLAFVALTMAANAQFILGGQLGFNTTSGNTHYEAVAPATAFDYPGYEQTSFTFAPTVSYVLNDKMQVGLSLSYSLNSNTTYGTIAAYAADKEDYVKFKTSTIGFAPYFRYYFAQAGNFNFFCEATLGFYITPRDYTYTFDNTWTPGVDLEVNGSSTNILQFSIVPGVNYKFSDKWSADCYIDLAGLAFNHRTTKNYGVGTDPDALNSTVTRNNFGLIANASAQDLNAHLGNFRIGFNYHF